MQSFAPSGMLICDGMYLQVAVAAFWAANSVPNLHSQRLIIATAASLVAGIVKEIGDHLKVRHIRVAYLLARMHCSNSIKSAQCEGCFYLQLWPGRFSLKDLAADFAGTAVGLSVIIAVEAYHTGGQNARPWDLRTDTA